MEHLVEKPQDRFAPILPNAHVLRGRYQLSGSAGLGNCTG